AAVRPPGQDQPFGIVGPGGIHRRTSAAAGPARSRFWKKYATGAENIHRPGEFPRQVGPSSKKAGDRTLSPLAPVLRGEGLGVRGSALAGSPSPSPPAPLP